MPSRSVSIATPSQVVSSFVHFVTQLMSTSTSSLGSARNSSQDHRVSSCPASVSIVKDQSDSGVCGVGPADSTGKSSVRYCPGGTRASSRSLARLPWNPLDTYAISDRPSASASLLPRPGPERLEEHLLLILGDLLLVEHPGQSDRLAHLLQVRGAAVADRQVLLDATAIVGRQDVLEVVRDELDHLVTGQRAPAHRSSHSSVR